MADVDQDWVAMPDWGAFARKVPRQYNLATCFRVHCRPNSPPDQADRGRDPGFSAYVPRDRAMCLLVMLEDGRPSASLLVAERASGTTSVSSETDSLLAQEEHARNRDT